MTIHSLRAESRPDNQKNQMRAGQSLARRIYLLALLAGIAWIGYQILGPLVIIDADGLVVQDREVIMPPYAAQVVDLLVRPGATVKSGDRIGTVVSTHMLDLISDLTSRKAQFDAREEQITARLSAITITLPTADRRLQSAEAAFTAMGKAAANGIITNARVAEVTRERYEALRETTSLRAEQSSLESERGALRANRARVTDALDLAQRTYRDGAITSPVSGTIGPRVVSPGTVLSSGDKIAEVHHGAKYVLAYVPINRFYATVAGQEVVVTDGTNRQVGLIERIEPITDQVPGEFQPSFHSIDRQQVVRVALADDSMFPLLSKIKVTSPIAPSSLLARGRDLTTGALARVSKIFVAEVSRALHAGPDNAPVGAMTSSF